MKHHNHERRRHARPPHHHDHDLHDRHRRGGSRLARLFEHGDLKLLILHLIAEKPRHGYELIKAVEDLAGGAYAPSPGIIYPTLTLLEELGHITATAEGPRKSYTIAEPGQAALTENQAAIQTILTRISAAQPRDAAPPILRAMENLKTALRLKLSTTEQPPEITQKIAAALDHAARQIEEA
jgi:DNA-binding PadR family transcriptional regulator